MKINNSRLQTYLKCGLKYEFEYVKELKRPQTFSLFRGTTVHLVRKRNLWAKISSRQDLPLEELREYALEQVNEAVSTESFVPEPEVESPANVIDGGVSVDYAEYQVKTQPVLVEHSVEVEVAGYDFSLHGTLDLLDENNKLRDLKTVGKSPQIADLLRSTQMSTYQLFAQADGRRIDKIAHDYLVFSKKGVKAVPLEVEPRTKADLRSLLDTYQAAVLGIQSGIFLPAPAGSWWCSPKWCPYWDICPAITKSAKQYYINSD